MSHQAVTWAYKQEIGPPSAKFVLVTLSNYADGEGHCYPGQETIAADTGMNERNVRRCLTTLEDAGLIYRQHRYDRHGKRTSDEFWLVGFKPLPDDIAGSLPDNLSASGERLPDISDTTTGHFEHDYRTNCPVPIRNLNRQSEPSEEPKDPEGDQRPNDVIAFAFLEQVGAQPEDVTESFARTQSRAVARMLRSGYCRSDILGCARFMQSQSWRTNPWDLTDVAKQIDKWIAASRPATEQPRASPGRVREPDFSGIEAFGQRMSEIERRKHGL